jgi:hypothetical protein
MTETAIRIAISAKGRKYRLHWSPFHNDREPVAIEETCVGQYEPLSSDCVDRHTVEVMPQSAPRLPEIGQE